MENKDVRYGWPVSEYCRKERAVRAFQGFTQVKAKINGSIGLDL